MKRSFLVFLLLITTAACQSMKPNARLFKHVPENAPALYKQGWKDGCQTGMSAGGNELYRISYQHTVSPELIEDPQYFQGWSDAERYCRQYVLSTLIEAGQLGKNPTQSTTELEESGGVFSVVTNLGMLTLFELKPISVF